MDEIDREILDAKLIGEATLEDLLAAVRQRCACLVLYAIEVPVAGDELAHYRRVSGDVTMVMGMLEYMRTYVRKRLLDEAPPL